MKTTDYLTKREIIAMHLMSALYSVNRYDESLCVTWAVSGADALLEKLAEEQPAAASQPKGDAHHD